MNAKFSLLLGWIMLGGVGAWAQSVPSQPLVVNAVAHDISPALSDMAPRVNFSPQGVGSEWPAALLASSRPSVGTTAGLNFDGVGASSNWLTADTSAAVGSTQYVQWVNVEFAVFDKTSGATLMGPVPGNSLWSGFGGVCQNRNDGDPSVQYDKAAGRWVMSHHATPSGGPYYECLAVSTTSDATGSYYRYAFPLPNYFPDYPKVAVWPDAYYVSINQQNQNNHYAPVAALLCALDRTAMLGGAPATAICFQVTAGLTDLSLLPSDLDGSTPPPSGSPNYFFNLGTNSLNLWKFHVDFQTPSNSTFTGPTTITVSAFREACGGHTCVPQLDTTELLDSVGDRLMNRAAYRNFGGYESVVLNHSVGGGNPSRSGIRWYEIRNPGGTPSVFQQGTFRPDVNFRWLGSIGMDKVGDIAVGYSVSSTTMHPAIRYSGRVPTDPVGTLEAEASIIEGTGSQQPHNSFWEDVSSLSIDPLDDCTFWYTNEYYQADSTANWSTRIASFKFASCN